MLNKDKKGYSSVSQVEIDSDEDINKRNKNSKNKPSMVDLLKASSQRRQRHVQNDFEQNINRSNNLPDINDDDDDDDTDSSNDDNNNLPAPQPPPPPPSSNPNGNNIGNIPGTSGQVTSCMNKSWKIGKLFGIEIHIHVLLPIFFVASFLIWIPLITSDSGNTIWYIILIILFNISLWETILIHELGHCLAGHLVGGYTDRVLLWPLGGLAFTQPPAQLNNAQGDSKRRRNHIIIALGGPVTHIPHMLLYAAALIWYCDTDRLYIDTCPYGNNPFKIWSFWQETIISLPNGQGLWFWYDYLMISFMLNFWLFIINLLIPAYPLDGSRIFINYLLGKYNKTTTATIYCWITGIIAVIAIVLGATVFRTQTMLFFTGIWAAFQVYQLSMLIQKSREKEHPLLNQS